MLDQTGGTAEATRGPFGSLVVRRAGLPAGAVRIANRRLLRLQSVIARLQPESAPGVLRRLLPVCGWAQGMACLRAIEAAAAIAPAPQTEAARERLLLAETALTHLWRFAIDWPTLIGLPPDPGPVRRAQSAVADLAAALWPDGSPLETMAVPGAKAADAACATLADLLEAACAYLPDTQAEFAAWTEAGGDMPAILLRRARALGSGSGLDADLPQPGFAAVARRLMADPGFGVAPDAGGRPADTGPLLALSAPERAACAALGPVAGRFAATMHDARRISARLRRTGGALHVAAFTDDGWGAGTAATARGPLVHVLRLSQAGIIDFRSVAPTEWMLHPQGALMRCLGALPADAPEADMRLIFAAFDPCAPLVFEPKAAEDA